MNGRLRRRSFHAQILYFAILARRPKCDLTKTAVSVVVAAYSGVEMSLWNVLSNASAFCALGRILLIGETIELPLGSPYTNRWNRMECKIESIVLFKKQN